MTGQVAMGPIDQGAERVRMIRRRYAETESQADGAVPVHARPRVEQRQLHARAVVGPGLETGGALEAVDELCGRRRGGLGCPRGPPSASGGRLPPKDVYRGA